MQLILTGTASGIPVAHRRHASVLLRRAEHMVLIDAGEGVSAALLSEDIDPVLLDTVIISHTHADHVTGLPLLLQGMHLAGREAPLGLWVPPGREQWFRDWFAGLYIFEEKWSFPVVLRPLEHELQFDDGMRILPFPNGHLDRVRELAGRHGIPADSFSFRIESAEGRVVLSSDIASIDDVADAAADADVLIADSTHVDVDELNAFAASHPGLTVICTHVPPELEQQAQDAGAGGVSGEREKAGAAGGLLFAHDGMVFDLEQQ